MERCLHFLKIFLKNFKKSIFLLFLLFFVFSFYRLSWGDPISLNWVKSLVSTPDFQYNISLHWPFGKPLRLIFTNISGPGLLCKKASILMHISDCGGRRLPFFPFYFFLKGKDISIDMDAFLQGKKSPHTLPLNTILEYALSFPGHLKRLCLNFSALGYAWRYRNLDAKISWKNTFDGFSGSMCIGQYVKNASQVSNSSKVEPYTLQPRGQLSITAHDKEIAVQGALSHVCFRAPLRPDLLSTLKSKKVSLTVDGHFSGKISLDSRGFFHFLSINSKNTGLFHIDTFSKKIFLDLKSVVHPGSVQQVLSLSINDAVPMDTLGVIWPPAWFSEPRHWILGRCKKGQLTRATCTMIFEKKHQSPWKNTSVHGSIEGKGLDITFLDDLESIKDTSVLGLFNKNGFSISIKKGEFYKNTAKGYVFIEFPKFFLGLFSPHKCLEKAYPVERSPELTCIFQEKYPSFFVRDLMINGRDRASLWFDIHLKGPLPILAEKALALLHVKKLPLRNMSALGNLCVSGFLPLHTQTSAKDLSLCIQGNVIQGSAVLPTYHHDFRIKNAEFSLSYAHNNPVSLKGTCVVDTFPTQWTWTEKGLTFSTQVPPSYVDLWLPFSVQPYTNQSFIPIKGTYFLSANDAFFHKKSSTYTSFLDQNLLDITSFSCLSLVVDLDNMVLSIPYFSWNKKKGTPLTIKLLKWISKSQEDSVPSPTFCQFQGAFEGFYFYNDRIGSQALWEMSAQHKDFLLSCKMCNGHRKIFLECDKFYWDPKWLRGSLKKNKSLENREDISRSISHCFSPNPARQGAHTLDIKLRCRSLIFPSLTVIGGQADFSGSAPMEPKDWTQWRHWRWHCASVSGSLSSREKAKTPWTKTLIQAPGKTVKFFGKNVLRLLGMYKFLDTDTSGSLDKTSFGHVVGGVCSENNTTLLAQGEVSHFGPLMKNIGFFDITAGLMRFYAFGSEHRWEGDILIERFMTKSLAMGKLLAFISPILFTEFFSTGLTFYRVGTHFLYENYKLTLKRAMAENLNVGFLLKGNIFPLKGTLYLEGVVTPVYFLNQFVSRFPLIGKIFESNTGILSSEFSVKGKLSQPELSWRPLSLFKLGIIRKFLKS